MRENFYKLIADIIKKETLFLRHYIGIVLDNNDELQKGRVLVGVPHLGWMTRDKAVWAWPRDKNSISVPAIDDWTEIYFVGGDPNFPCYLGIAHEMNDMVAKSYDGDRKNHILFEDPVDENQHIKYNDLLKTLIIKISGELKLETGDASGWMPSIIPNCPFSGAPHGGATAGIVKLKGG